MCVVCMGAVLVSSLPEQPRRSYLLPSPRGSSSPQVLPAPGPIPQAFPAFRGSSLPVLPAPRPLPQVLTNSNSQVPTLSSSQSLFLTAGQGLPPRSEPDSVQGLSQTEVSDPDQLQGLALAAASGQNSGQGSVPSQGQAAVGPNVISFPGPARPAAVPAPALDRLYQAPPGQTPDSNVIASPSQTVDSAVISVPRPGDVTPGIGSRFIPDRVLQPLGNQTEQEPAAAEQSSVVETAPGVALAPTREGSRSPESSFGDEDRLAAGSSPDADIDSLAASEDQLSVSGTLRDGDQDTTSSGTTGMVSTVVCFSPNNCTCHKKQRRIF